MKKNFCFENPIIPECGFEWAVIVNIFIRAKFFIQKRISNGNKNAKLLRYQYIEIIEVSTYRYQKRILRGKNKD